MVLLIGIAASASDCSVHQFLLIESLALHRDASSSSSVRSLSHTQGYRRPGHLTVALRVNRDGTLQQVLSKDVWESERIMRHVNGLVRVLKDHQSIIEELYKKCQYDARKSAARRDYEQKMKEGISHPSGRLFLKGRSDPHSRPESSVTAIGTPSQSCSSRLNDFASSSQSHASKSSIREHIHFAKEDDSQADGICVQQAVAKQSTAKPRDETGGAPKPGFELFTFPDSYGKAVPIFDPLDIPRDTQS